MANGYHFHSPRGDFHRACTLTRSGVLRLRWYSQVTQGCSVVTGRPFSSAGASHRGASSARWSYHAYRTWS